jgi:glutathione S-transferase
MLELWSGVLSPFSAKVRIALAEKGLPCKIREVPWSRTTLWGPKPPEFLAVSPHAQVPVLIDGLVTIHDSTTICEYLEDRFPEPPLMPPDPAGRALCRELEDEADRAVQLAVSALVREVFVKPDPSTRHTAVVETALRDIVAYHAMLERALEGRTFLCDGAFTLADIASFLPLSYAATLGAPIAEERTRLRAWLERTAARPTVAAELAAITEAAARA